MAAAQGGPRWTDGIRALWGHGLEAYANESMLVAIVGCQARAGDGTGLAGGRTTVGPR